MEVMIQHGLRPLPYTSIPDLADSPVPQRIDLEHLHHGCVPDFLQHLGPGIGLFQSIGVKTLGPDLGTVEEILLLDDVLSELDSNRQNYLLNSIGNIQTIVTCTGLDEFINSRLTVNKIFKVSGGKVVREN